MLRESALSKDFFDIRYRHAEDYAAWLKLSRQGDIEILPAKLLKYRIHGRSVSYLNKLPQFDSAMTALGNHLAERYAAHFHLDAVALWAAPHVARSFEKPDDFYRLLRWMNPLTETFRAEMSVRSRVKALVHYYRRLLLLLIWYRRRVELVVPIMSAIALSLMPMRARRKGG
jgi:hypothetical protein